MILSIAVTLAIQTPSAIAQTIDFARRDVAPVAEEKISLVPHRSPGDPQFLPLPPQSHDPNEWQIVEFAPTPERHHWYAWFKRHPLADGMIGGGLAGFVYWRINYHPCPKRINGYPYDGTGPCPGKNYDPGPRK